MAGEWDVVERTPISAGEWDVVERAPISAPKRAVGAGETAARTGKGLLYSASAAAAAPVVGLARLADMAVNLLGGPEDAAQRWLGDVAMVPALSQVEQAALKPTEDAGPAGNVLLQAAPMVGKFLPDLAMGMGLQGATRAATQAVAPLVERGVPAITNALRSGTVAGIPAGQRVGQERRMAIEEAGGTPFEAQLGGAASGLATTGQFALPASAGSAAATLPGRVVSRGAQGAAINVPAGMAQRQVENLTTPERMTNLQQPVADPSAVAMDAILGGLFGQMGGRMPSSQTVAEASIARGMDVTPPARQAGYLADFERYRPLLAANGITDPESPGAMMAVASLRAREARLAELEAARAAEETPPMPPEQVPGRPQGTIYVDPQGRAEARADVQTPRGRMIIAPSGEKAGMAATEGVRGVRSVRARQDFEEARRQAERKQQAQDEASLTGEPRDLQEARAAGTTSREGTAAMRPEQFAFLDVQRNRSGNVIGTGPQVEILGETVMQTPRGEIPAYAVRYELPDGTVREEVVPARRVGVLERPANPRFAQDIAATTYAPPRGVGTGPEQPQPRTAAQRITTRPSPEFVPAEQGAPGRQVARAPQTYPGESARMAEGPLPREDDVLVGGSNVPRDRTPTVETPAEADARLYRERQREAGATPYERAAPDIPEPLALPRPGQSSYVDVEAGREGAVTAEDRRVIGRQARDAARRESDATEARKERQDRIEQREGDDAQLPENRPDRGEPPLERRSGEAAGGGRRVQQGRAEQEVAPKRGRRAPLNDARIDDPDYRSALELMAEQTGLAERGGFMIRDPITGNVTGRTKPIANAEWWLGRPGTGTDRRGNVTGRLSEARVKEAVRKALAGEELNALEQQTISYMLKYADERIVQPELSRRELEAEGRRELELEAEGKLLSDMRLDEEDDFFDIVGRELSQEEADAFFGYKPSDAAVEGAVPARGEDERAPHQGGREGGSPLQRPDTPGERPADQPGRDRGSSEFSLRGETPDELRARAERERVEAEQQRTRARAPGPDDFKLTGSDRAADEAEARGQQRLDDDAGTLYSNPFGKVLEWAMGGTPTKIAKSIKEWIGDIRDTARTPRAPGSMLRAIFDTAAGEVGAIVNKSGSKTAKWVYDQFAATAGGKEATPETVHSAAVAYTNTRLKELDRLLAPIIADKAALNQVANLIRNPTSIRSGNPIHDAARGIGQMLNDALTYMRDSGVDVGEVKRGYFPREYKRALVAKDPQGFIEAATRAYRETGMPSKHAMLAAQELHDAILFGDNAMFGGRATQTSVPFLKGRVFGKQIDAETHPLNRFLESDPTITLVRYFDRVGRRAEVAKRFGDNFSNWSEIAQKIRQEGGGEIVQQLGEFAAMGAGMYRQGGRGLMAAMSGLRTWGALMFLEKATLSSLTEFMVTATRTGNVADMGRSLARTIGDLVQTTKGAERRAFAEDMGLLAGHLAESLQIGRFVGDLPISRLEQKVMNRYFRRTGLTQWTEATTASSADMGRVFLRRLSFDAKKGGKLTQRYLAELGIPAERQAQFAEFVRGFGDRMPGAGDLKGDMGALYRAAIRRFALQSIMRPDQTLRPRWMSTPLGSVIGQLQSFNYALWENVIKRHGRLTKAAVSESGYSLAERARMMSWMLTFPPIVAGAYAIGEARDALLGSRERREEETGTDKLLKAASRGLPIAPLDPLLNIVSGAKYQRSATEAIAGPVLGSYGRGIDAFLTYFNEKRNSENTNTAERNAMKAIYDLAIEPTLNFALTPLSGPLASALTVGAIPAARDRFVDATAGEKEDREASYY